MGGLFNDSSRIDSIWYQLDDRQMINGKYLEGSSHTLILVPAWRDWGKPWKNCSQGSQCPGRDLNEAPPKCRSGVLSLDEPVWWQHDECKICNTQYSEKGSHVTHRCTYILESIFETRFFIYLFFNYLHITMLYLKHAVVPLAIMSVLQYNTDLCKWVQVPSVCTVTIPLKLNQYVLTLCHYFIIHYQFKIVFI